MNLLWIRSQDKETLLNVNKLEIIPFVYSNEITNYNKFAIKGNDVILGIYMGIERPLEILDEIQITLEDLINDRIVDNIYQLPTE